MEKPDIKQYKRYDRMQAVKGISLTRALPNFITLVALCIGFSGVRFALLQRWEAAVICIFIAAILDGMDGRLARLLRGSSRFGAELDSFADACNFGVAPALIIYLYSLSEFKQIGWAVCLFYIICMVLRLARFNTFLNAEQPLDKSSRFFIGVSAPVGAIYALLPLMLVFEFPDQLEIPKYFYLFYLIVISLLLILPLPTFSFKGGRIPKKWGWVVFVGIGLVGIFMVTEPWLTLNFMGLCYALSFPWSYKAYHKMRRASLAP